MLDRSVFKAPAHKAADPGSSLHPGENFSVSVLFTADKAHGFQSKLIHLFNYYSNTAISFNYLFYLQ